MAGAVLILIASFCILLYPTSAPRTTPAFAGVAEDPPASESAPQDEEDAEEVVIAPGGDDDLNLAYSVFDWVAPMPSPLLLPEETRLADCRQLTFGHSIPDPANGGVANYAEAYWAPGGKSLILQATRDDFACDQAFQLDLLTGSLELVSTGFGRVTCAFICADNEHFIYSSTHENGGPYCPESPDRSQGYVWPLYDSYDIYLAELATGEIVQNLTNSPGYDAEGTLDWNTGWLYFTSTRGGDLDIYRLNVGSPERVERLTDEPGYDGGPFVSYDGSTVVYRRSFLESEEEREDYERLLERDLIRPGKLELMVMDSDGANKRQLTANGAANFAPFLHPDNETIIFCSNMHNPGGRDFDLYTMPLDGGEPERITFHPDFDGFPMFSPDGRYLVWCSNRNNSEPYETNLFIAKWVP
ncbi:PD40 domain-containing protein [bacterium]|nr:PD40 domain-containing protein [bacterium]